MKNLTAGSNAGFDILKLFEDDINTSFSNTILVNADKTPSIVNHTLLVTTGSSIINITLLSALNRKGKEFMIKKVDNGIGNVLISTTLSQLIDDVLTVTLYKKNDTLFIISDGVNWQVIYNII